MYFAVVTLLLFVLPVASTIVETMAAAPFTVAVVCKWYAFWAVGVRLVLSGFSQITRPQFTQKILGIPGDESRILVRELGFANTSLGVLGLASLALTEWRVAAAAAGGLFYLLAGIGHAAHPHRNRKANFAMVSDLVAGAVLLGCVAALLV